MTGNPTTELAPLVYQDPEAVLANKFPDYGRYLETFRGLDPFAVIKIGGGAVDDPEQLSAVVDSVVWLQQLDLKAVLLHGGGDQIDRELAGKPGGYEPHRVNGIRTTAPEDMSYVAAALGKVNAKVCQAIRERGGRVAGISDIFTATIDDPSNVVAREIIDVDLTAIRNATTANMIPVVSCIGHTALNSASETRPVNINADKAGADLAVWLEVLKYMSVTGIGAVVDTEADRKLDNVNASQVEELKQRGIITAGMIPKIDESVALLNRGVHDVVITSPHAIMHELFSDEGEGTIFHYQN